jgi:glycosyltransferase involved in cell wall biosynthesis
MPIISIVTINRNNGAGLRSTLFSVVSQTFGDYEYIVVDGASSDDSLQILDQFSDSVDLLIAEPDNGIYYAMNKGLEASSGDYIIFLNSGDFLATPHVLSLMALSTPQYDVVYGNIAIIKKTGLELIKTPERIQFSTLYQHNLPPHPSLLARRELYLDQGMFDVSYSVTADVLAISRIFADPQVSYTKVDSVIAIFDHSGISSLDASALMIYRERRDFISRFFPSYMPDLEYHIRLSPSRWLYLQACRISSVFGRLLRRASKTFM